MVNPRQRLRTLTKLLTKWAARADMVAELRRQLQELAISHPELADEIEAKHPGLLTELLANVEGRGS